LVQSDSVLRPVAERYKLKVVESPPLPGEPQLPTSRAQNAPVKLKNLKVTRPPNTYLLLIAYRSPDADLASDVANAIARQLHPPHLPHPLPGRRRPFHLHGKTDGRTQGQNGEDPPRPWPSSKRISASSTPTRRPASFHPACSSSTTITPPPSPIACSKRPPITQSRGGSIEAAEASSQGEQLRKLADRVDEAREGFATVKAQFGANHPEYKKANSTLTELERQLDSLKANIGQRVNLEYKQAVNRESLLKVQVAETKAEFDRLNARSFEYKVAQAGSRHATRGFMKNWSARSRKPASTRASRTVLSVWPIPPARR
jgi:polysaccharide biosynthesis transport protein